MPIVLQSRRGPTSLVYTGTIGLLTPAHVTCTLECHQSTPDNLFPVYSILSTLRPKFLLRTECISSLWATLNPRKVVFKLLATMSTGSSFSTPRLNFLDQTGRCTFYYSAELFIDFFMKSFILLIS